MKALRVFVTLVVIAGGGLTARATYLHAKAQLAGALIRRAWEQTGKTGESRVPWPGADMRAVARIRIPRLRYDETVLDNAAPRTLAFGPTLLLSGSRPGRPGNLVLAGHRDTWFLPLESIRREDEIRIDWYDSRQHEVMERTYRVERIEVVDPGNTEFIEPTTKDELTLVTCYPFSRLPFSPQRFVVRAAPVGPSQPLEKAKKAGAQTTASTQEEAWAGSMGEMGSADSTF